MIIAIDSVKYSSFIYTVGAVFQSWTSKKPNYYITSKKEYYDGISELDCFINCIKMTNLSNLTHVIIRGFVWTSEDGLELKKGFGKKLQEVLEKQFLSIATVIGISDIPYSVPIPYCSEIKRGNESLWVTSSGYFLTESDAILIKRMSGDEVIPDIIQDVRRKVMGYIDAK